MPDCLFCKIIAEDMPAQKVYEDDRVFAFLDIHPVNPGHTLVIPKAHAANLLETAEEDATAMLAAVRKVAPAVMRAAGADSWNLGANSGRAAGQLIFHAHLHVIPRFPADGYEHWRGPEDHSDLEAMAAKIRGEL